MIRPKYDLRMNIWSITFACKISINQIRVNEENGWWHLAEDVTTSEVSSSYIFFSIKAEQLHCSQLSDSYQIDEGLNFHHQRNDLQAVLVFGKKDYVSPQRLHTGRATQQLTSSSSRWIGQKCQTILKNTVEVAWMSFCWFRLADAFGDVAVSSRNLVFTTS